MNKYDLEERTTIFSENIISLSKQIYKSEISKPLINQLLRSATSVGANYCEANGASSKKDFRHKISLCKKEIQESKYWLRLLKNYDKKFINEISKLWEEAQELTLIFQKIFTTVSKKSDH